MDNLLEKIEREYLGKYDCQLRHILQEFSIVEIVNNIMGWLSAESADAIHLDYVEITTIARDFYVGSNLTDQEKNQYYKELRQQGFFNVLDKNLYSDDFAKCSWTIYSFGKFSNTENAKYLEIAYEKRYVKSNPILSQRCLTELSWLGSQKVETYLVKLKNNNDIISKLILLMYWECRSESEETNKLLSNKELIQFISPYNENLSKEEILFNRLNNFKNHIFKMYSENSAIDITNHKFIEIAKTYFENFTIETDIDAEREHREFIKSLGK